MCIYICVCVFLYIYIKRRDCVIFVSCKANVRIFDAKSGHGPHSPLPGAGASPKRLTSVAYLQYAICRISPVCDMSHISSMRYVAYLRYAICRISPVCDMSHISSMRYVAYLQYAICRISPVCDRASLGSEPRQPTNQSLYHAYLVQYNQGSSVWHDQSRPSAWL